MYLRTTVRARKRGLLDMHAVGIMLSPPALQVLAAIFWFHQKQQQQLQLQQQL
jgi:hypothetical protein